MTETHTSQQPPGQPQEGPPADFPPATLEAFLRCCAGEWMSLRSRFELGASATIAAPDGEGDEWHSSERGDLLVQYLEPAQAHEPGGLSLGPKGEPQRQLHFSGNGRFRAGERQGHWQLWPDGSLELTVSDGATALRERIWFTIESSGDGSPSRASFSSEIRRVSRPASDSNAAVG
jgi:hypothetical protein